MEDFKVILNYKLCSFRQEDFKDIYCSHPGRNRTDANGWETCCLPVCPSVYEPSNTRMHMDKDPICDICLIASLAGGNFCSNCGRDLSQ